METKEYVEALDKEIRRFAGRLRKSFGPQIERDPRFRGKVIGKLRASLPRRRPGRKANPLIVRAVEIYSQLTAEGKKGKDGVWHQVALKAHPDYAKLPMDSQRLIRYSLCASVHSVRHEAAARELRKQKP